ncbi:MAG: KamA family radical SAM protein [Planctomycetota bacterium]
MRGFLRRTGGAFADVPDARWHDWQWQVAHRITRPDELAQLLGLAPATRAALMASAAVWPLSVTPYYLDLVDPCDPHDPILPQILPAAAELSGAGEPDPFREDELTVAPGLVHRYPDRALLVLTNLCATLCRHCMRKRAWQEPWYALGEGELRAALDYIAAHRAIRDVLVSGGDPLNLSPGLLRMVVSGLRAIGHLDLIRIGSRVPVTLPQRIDDEMLAALGSGAPLYLNTHFNHARELTADATAACARLACARIQLGNQAVLLRGVNDTEEALLDLSRALLRAGVRPYYLHHGDPVQGATHFQVPVDEGRALVRSLYGKVTGMGIPRYVVDLPGGGGKVPVELGFDRGRAVDDALFESPLLGRVVRVPAAYGHADREPPTPPPVS